MVPFTPRLLRPTLRTALLRSMLGITILEATATTMVGIAAIGAAGNYMMKSADQAQEQQAGAHLEAVRKGVERYVKAEHSTLSGLAPNDAKLKPTLKDLRDGNYLPNSDVLTDLNSFSQTYAVRIRQVPTGAGKPANLEALVITQPGGSASVALSGAALRRVARGLGTQGGYIEEPPAGSPTPSTLAVVGHGGSWEAKPADFGYTPADLKAGHMAALSVFNGADLVSAASPHKPDDYLHRKSDAAGRNKMEVDLNLGSKNIMNANSIGGSSGSELQLGDNATRIALKSAVFGLDLSSNGENAGDDCQNKSGETKLGRDPSSGNVLVCDLPVAHDGTTGATPKWRKLNQPQLINIRSSELTVFEPPPIPNSSNVNLWRSEAYCPTGTKVISGHVTIEKVIQQDGVLGGSTGPFSDLYGPASLIPGARAQCMPSPLYEEIDLINNSYEIRVAEPGDSSRGIRPYSPPYVCGRYRAVAVCIK